MIKYGWEALLMIVVCLMVTLTGRVHSANVHQAETEDNEFAEFEDFDDDDDDGGGNDAGASADGKPGVTLSRPSVHDQDRSAKASAPAADMADEATVEDEDDEDTDDVEFEHFQDDEEFEGFEQGKPGSGPKSRPETADINITKVPIHLRTNWDSFYLEMLMIAGLVVYFLNFIAGKTKNQKIAQSWLDSHRQLLDSNFQLVGDNGKSTETDSPSFVKDSENIYALWCSGRTCCESMFVEMLLLKRQDLVHVVMQMLRPASDQIVIRVTMNPDDMDSFVFAIANKKSAVKLSKEIADISIFCPEKKSVERFGLPTSLVLFNELAEVPASILDSKVVAIINKYEELIDYIHFSDQFTGAKTTEDTQVTKIADAKKVLIFAFNIPGRGRSSAESTEAMKPLLQLVFYCMDKVKRFRLGKEAKQKAEKTRSRIEGEFLKQTHQQRVEAAQQKREEKRRAEKERIMNEEDPEKQRKWEEREHRRELKKRAPKMKQLKVKAM